MNILPAINYMISIGFRLPYGVIPGSYPGGINPDFNFETWGDYAWNPPIGYDEIDDECSAKFSWRQILWAFGEAVTETLKKDLTLKANLQCTQRIALAYHAGANYDRSKEWQARLNPNADLSVPNAERVRLIEVCHGLEARIEAAVGSYELESIVVEDDDVWAI